MTNKILQNFKIYVTKVHTMIKELGVIVVVLKCFWTLNQMNVSLLL